MKAKKQELSVDYIGGQGLLTLAEERRISEYLTKKKLTLKKVKGLGKTSQNKQASQKARRQS